MDLNSDLFFAFAFVFCLCRSQKSPGRVQCGHDEND